MIWDMQVGKEDIFGFLSNQQDAVMKISGMLIIVALAIRSLE
jgi:hypothetical protein